MGDSDEEYDRRRSRDKFRRERSDYQERSTGTRRDDWIDSRDGWGGSSSNRDRMNNRGREYSRDNYGSNQRRDRYGSPGDRSDMSPPVKRIRSRDWDERGNTWTGMDSHMQMGGQVSYGTNASQNQGSSDSTTGPTQPLMMTFKQFLPQNDDIDDSTELVKRYEEYKCKFKRARISEFFTAHKEEAWFKARYYPDECEKRKEAIAKSFQNRLNVFLDLLNNGWLDSVSIDVEKSDKIIRLLDAAVIKLEGGTDFDLQALDSVYEDDKPKEPGLSLFSVDVDRPIERIETIRKDEKRLTCIDEKKEESKIDDRVEFDLRVVEKERVLVADSNDISKNSDIQGNGENKENKSFEEKETQEDIEEGQRLEEETRQDNKDDTLNRDAEPIKPRPLHKKSSIFLRNIAPDITKAEIENLFKDIPGYLRVAISDPAPERKFLRRGWVTFSKSVNIREICLNISNAKIRDCELGAIVNRDLTRRIRSVNGIASHKNVVRSDIRHAAKIAFNMDCARGLWEDEKDPKDDGKSGSDVSFVIQSKNPLLKNIADYMIEEAPAEEEELLGEKALDDEEGEGGSLERDENSIKVLDRLLVYLRIVHSIDYYNASDYPNEDEMPNRIGIMHARGAPPSSKVTAEEISEYLKEFEDKIASFLVMPAEITEEEAIKLGKKDPDEEVEKFVKENTVEVAQDKWLCPLSNKKFKAPDFVRKHIFNKHEEIVEDLRKDVDYFNNYLMDPKRIALPPHPLNRPSTGGSSSVAGSGTSGSLSKNEGNAFTAGPMAAPWIHPTPFPGAPPYLGGYPVRGAPPIGFPGPMGGWPRGYMMMGQMDNRLARNRFARPDSRELAHYGDLDETAAMI